MRVWHLSAHHSAGGSTSTRIRAGRSSRRVSRCMCAKHTSLTQMEPPHCGIQQSEPSVPHTTRASSAVVVAMMVSMSKSMDGVSPAHIPVSPYCSYNFWRGWGPHCCCSTRAQTCITTTTRFAKFGIRLVLGLCPLLLSRVRTHTSAMKIPRPNSEPYRGSSAERASMQKGAVLRICPRRKNCFITPGRSRAKWRDWSSSNPRDAAHARVPYQ